MIAVYPDWTVLELDVLRGGLAVAVLWSFDSLHRTPHPHGRSHPQGWARIVPFGWTDHPLFRRALPLIVWTATAAHLLDRATVVALAALLVVLVVEVTRDNSGGGGGHRHHLVVTVVAAQLAAAVAWWWFDGDGPAMAESAAATMAWWSVQAIVAVYFVSGVEKLLATNGRWLARSPGLLVRALSVQTAAQMRPSARKRAAGRRAERLVGRLVPRPGLTRVLFGVGLAIELAAPVGLLDPVLLPFVGVALLALHAANGVLLGLPFLPWQLLVALFLVLPALLPG